TKTSYITRCQAKFKISTTLTLHPDTSTVCIFITPFKFSRQIHTFSIGCRNTRINTMNFKINFAIEHLGPRVFEITGIDPRLNNTVKTIPNLRQQQLPVFTEINNLISQEGYRQIRKVKTPRVFKASQTIDRILLRFIVHRSLTMTQQRPVICQGKTHLGKMRNQLSGLNI